MKKKLVLGILSCIMAISCLAGCNGEADTTASSTEVPATTEEGAAPKQSFFPLPGATTAPSALPKSE